MITKILTILIKPFYWSWIWKYFPFKQINIFYNHISSWKQNIYKTIYGFKMFLDWSKFIDKEITFNWFWEKNISELIKKELHQWDIFLDIWANIWYFSLLWSIQVWEEWEIISFEPSSINYNELEKNIKLNNLKNIKTHKLWVWNEENEFNIYYNNNNPWATSLVKTNENKLYNKEKIKLIKLDDLLRNKKIDFIKMDIEWYEYNAIIWMENILKNNNLKMIFEYSPRIYKEKEKDYKLYSINLLNRLSEYNFDLFHINSDSSLRKINNNEEYFTEIINNKIWQSDVYCIKK